jgi:hypothetical protein
VSQVVESLPSKCEALSSNPSTIKKKKKHSSQVTGFFSAHSFMGSWPLGCLRPPLTQNIRPHPHPTNNPRDLPCLLMVGALGVSHGPWSGTLSSCVPPYQVESCPSNPYECVPVSTPHPKPSSKRREKHWSALPSQPRMQSPYH